MCSCSSMEWRSYWKAIQISLRIILSSMNSGIRLLTKSISYKYRCGRTYAKVAPWSDKFHGYPSPDQFVGSNIRAERSGVRVLAGTRDLSRTSWPALVPISHLLNVYTGRLLSKPLLIITTTTAAAHSSKFLCVQYHEGIWGSGGIPPYIRALDGGEWWASHASCATLKERAPIPIE